MTLMTFLSTFFGTLLVICTLVIIYLPMEWRGLRLQQDTVKDIAEDNHANNKLLRRLQKLHRLQSNLNSDYYIPNGEVALVEECNQYVASSAFVDNYHLGNELFIFAAVYGIARMNGLTPLIKLRYKVQHVHALFRLFRAPMTHIYLPLDKTENIGEMSYGKYDPSIENLTQKYSTNITISGYRQSWKYFVGYEEEIRAQFTLLPEFRRKSEEMLDKVIPYGFQDKSYIRVGIHVRRGDMLKANLVKYGNNVATEEYFKNARDYFQRIFPKVIFVVVTNDVPWTKKHIVGNNVFYASTSDDLLDFATLTLMDHMIMSVGTYGWWAAFLINGVTVYYAKPYLPNTYLSLHYTQDDFYPPNWIPMT